MESSRSSVSYESEIVELRADVEEKEQLLHRAGEIGKHLLDENLELNKQLDKLQNDYAGKIEELTQERHSLQMRLDQKSRLEQNYIDDTENLKTSLKKQREEFEQLRNAEHTTKVAEMKRLVESLQASLDSSQLQESQLREKNGRLEEQLNETREQLQLKISAMNETCSMEMAEMHSDLTNAQAEKMSLAAELCDVNDLCVRLKQQMRSLQQQLESKDSELSERACLATSYYNALEKSREEVMELNVQLDILKMETQDHKKKGNSLFAELDDKRQDAEKKLISQTVQLETLKKKYDLSQQQLHKLRMQMAALLQMSGSQADSTHVDRLKTQLSRARGEIDLLTEKNQRLEKQEKTKQDQMMEVGKAFGGKLDKNYVDYMAELLKTKEAEVEKTKQGLETLRMLNISEQNKVVELERKVYVTEVARDKHRNEAIKLALKLDEYKVKYEPETFKKKANKRFNVETIPGLKKADTDTTEGKPLAKVEKKILSDSANTNQENTLPAVIEIEKAVKGKTVRLSEDVDVFDVSLVELEQSRGSVPNSPEKAAGENKKPTRPRGRQTYHNVVKAPSDEGTGECQTQ